MTSGHVKILTFAGFRVPGVLEVEPQPTEKQSAGQYLSFRILFWVCMHWGVLEKIRIVHDMRGHALRCAVTSVREGVNAELRI